SRGGESDLRGYSVAGDAGSRSGQTAAFCAGASCSAAFGLPAGKSGSVAVTVTAQRSDGAGGLIGSAGSRASVTVSGPPASAKPSTGASASASASASATPGSPSAKPGKSGKAAAPAGTVPQFALPGGQAGTGAVPAANVSRAGNPAMLWGGSLAAVVVLLLCGAHVGTRIRRRRPGPVDAADPGDQPAITVRYEDPFSSEAPAER
ncbi:MAG: hypothetical protein JWN00_5106, partial [Actinomycetia bacterium]|nr:hypothetical protein [Actinomycetes bacterium]